MPRTFTFTISADLHWWHSVIDDCHKGDETGVDLAYNITIIPNPDKPIPHAGIITRWRYSGNVSNHNGEAATAYLQLWRAAGSMFTLVGQTEVTITTSGDHEVILNSTEQLRAEKYDLIGITMAGPGSIDFYKNTSETHCVLVGVERSVYYDIDSPTNFSRVWLDDWTYDVTAEILPEGTGNVYYSIVKKIQLEKSVIDRWANTRANTACLSAAMSL